MASNKGGCGLKGGGRAVAVALLVIVTGLLTASALGAQGITPVAHAHFDPLRAQSQTCPGHSLTPWIQIQPTAVDI